MQEVMLTWRQFINRRSINSFLVKLNEFAAAHPCNMKDFKIYGGVSEDALTELLHSHLKNDTQPEIFELKHVNDQGILTPIRYIKIIPLRCAYSRATRRHVDLRISSSHGGGFHISIWHVALKGIKDEVFVEQVRMKYDQVRGLCLHKRLASDCISIEKQQLCGMF
jgi:hypothetical protein